MDLKRFLSLWSPRVCIVMIIGFFAGCTHNIPLKATFDQPLNVSQLPITMGVYYSIDFRDYKHVGSRGGDRWEFPLGAASLKLFDQSLPFLFAGQVPVNSRPPLPADPFNCSAVIEPRIEAFDFDIPFLKTGTYTAEITYRLILYSMDGATVASWTVKGTGSKTGQPGFEFSRWPGEAADLAMEDATKKLVSSFSDVPEVRRWLKENNLLAWSGPLSLQQ